ncbi:MAG: DUF1847 domain-containing protein [Candidatus Lokiarchaeota archaeon]|nr:DUF1847 domain-containing protein [Candidatus Lokiarchaeota archaeon]MBD3202201.1 DUF1847 domain-containing protein [Candidatus Lokiarchaeota archaeon]
MKEEDIDPTCYKCNSINYCSVGRASKKLDNCPMKIHPEIEKKAKEIYKNNEEIKESTKIASIVEAQGYIRWPRLKDTVEYARQMNYRKLGLAFCVGLIKEAERVAEILEKYDFDVCGVCCKTGGVKKTDVGIPEEYTMFSKTGYTIGWITCNPVGQASLLNEAKTDMNIICGLCVGHDITFTKLSDAPVTTLIAKDRAMPHNPAGVLFSHYGKEFFASEFKKMKQKGK